jgi:hypothetical protein
LRIGLIKLSNYAGKTLNIVENAIAQLKSFYTLELFISEDLEADEPFITLKASAIHVEFR